MSCRGSRTDVWGYVLFLSVATKTKFLLIVKLLSMFAFWLDERSIVQSMNNTERLHNFKRFCFYRHLIPWYTCLRCGCQYMFVCCACQNRIHTSIWPSNIISGHSEFNLDWFNGTGNSRAVDIWMTNKMTLSRWLILLWHGNSGQRFVWNNLSGSSLLNTTFRTKPCLDGLYDWFQAFLSFEFNNQQLYFF